MRLSMPVLFLSVLLPAAAQAQPPRYLELVNQSYDDVVSLRVAAQGAPVPSDVALDGQLRGGGGSQTVAVHREGCRYDLRFAFADGRSLRYEGVDLCRYGKVVVRPLPRGSQQRDYVMIWGRQDDVAATAGQRVPNAR